MPRRPVVQPGPVSERVGRVGFLVLFAFVPLAYRSDLYGFTVIPKRLLVQVVLAVVAALWFLDRRAGRVPRPPRTPAALPILLYLVLCILSLTQAVNPVSGLVDVGHQLTFALLFVIGLRAFPMQAIPDLLRTGAAVGIVVSILGILEYWGADMAWLPSNGRPSATFGYRNMAASYLIMNIPLAVALLAGSRDLRDVALGSVSTGLMAIFLVYTRTRGAWAGLAGAGVLTALLLIYARHRWGTRLGLSKRVWTRRAALAVWVPVAVLVLVLSPLSPRIKAPHSRAIDEKKVQLTAALASVAVPGADRGRLDMWRHSREMIWDRPILGVGAGNWRYVYPRYDGGDMLRHATAPERPHNDLLWIASETGLPGLAAFLWILAAAAASLVRILRHPRDPGHALFAAAFGASALAMLGHGCFSFPRESVETSLLFWMALAVLARLDAPDRPPTRRTRDSGLVRLSHGLVAVLLVLSAWLTLRHAWFDGHYLRARQFHKGDDLPSTHREAVAALVHGPFDATAFLLKGNGLESAGRMVEATRAYREGLRYHPNSIQLLGALGTAYARRDSLDQAEGYYRRALSIYPDYYQMYNNLGGIYKKRGDLEGVAEVSLQVIKRAPGYIDAYRNLGLAYLDAGRPDDAVQIYLRAVERAPDDPVLHCELGDAYFAKAAQDTSALPLALSAYEAFLKTWTGPREYTATPLRRVEVIRRRLAGADR